MILLSLYKSRYLLQMLILLFIQKKIDVQDLIKNPLQRRLFDEFRNRIIRDVPPNQRLNVAHQLAQFGNPNEPNAPVLPNLADNFADLTNLNPLEQLQQLGPASPFGLIVNEVLRDEPTAISFYGKVLGFTRQFDAIKELYMGFTPFTKNTTCQLDERTLDAIHNSCPSLESLHLYGFYMTYSGYSCNIQANENTYTQDGYLYGDFSHTMPCPKLKHLSFQASTVAQPECFKYLCKKYSLLSKLHLNLGWVRVYGDEQKVYIDGLFKMIAEFEQLKELGVDDSRFEGHFPYDQLLSWLSMQPDRLKSLPLYTADMVPVESKITNNMRYELDEDDYESVIKSRTKYLDHLASIYLKTLSPVNTLRYLLRSDRSSIASTTITTLCLIGEDCRLSNFYFYEWMDALPNLKELRMKSLCITEDTTMDMDTITTTDLLMVIKNRLCPKLKLLKLKDVFIKLKGEFNEICQVCPSLTSILMEDIGIVDYYTPIHVLRYSPQTRQDKMKLIQKIITKSPINDFIFMDASHLKLESLFMQSIQCGTHNMRIYKERRVPILLTINEKGYNNTIQFSRKIFTPSIQSMKINCYSIGNLVFEDGIDQ